MISPCLAGDLSLVRYGDWTGHLLLGRTFMFVLRTKKTLRPLKNLKPETYNVITTLFENIGFSQPCIQLHRSKYGHVVADTVSK